MKNLFVSIFLFMATTGSIFAQKAYLITAPEYEKEFRNDYNKQKDILGYYDDYDAFTRCEGTAFYMGELSSEICFYYGRSKEPTKVKVTHGADGFVTKIYKSGLQECKEVVYSYGQVISYGTGVCTFENMVKQGTWLYRDLTAMSLKEEDIYGPTIRVFEVSTAGTYINDIKQGVWETNVLLANVGDYGYTTYWRNITKRVYEKSGNLISTNSCVKKDMKDN